MNKIECEILKFEDSESAILFIENNNIQLYMDSNDIILCYEGTEGDIRDNWFEITSQLALQFQSNLVDDVLANNLLLVFCTKDNLDIELKKEIQSNTYGFRKLVRSNVKNITDSIRELIFYEIEAPKKNDSIPLSDIIKTKYPDIFHLLSRS